MNRKKVLVIDDERIVCRGLEKELRGAGYQTDSAGSCEEALDKIKADNYDLVFVDLVLPGKDGVETCKEIKAISPKTELVFMTGMLKEDPIFKELQFVKAGGQAYYLYKPFLDGEILDAAKKILGE